MATENGEASTSEQKVDATSTNGPLKRPAPSDTKEPQKKKKSKGNR